MNSRVLVCTVVGVVAILCLFAFTPKQVFLPKGMILPAKRVRAPISASKVVIYHQAPEQAFQRLGEVHVELAFHTPNQRSRNLLLQKVKHMAAKIGANGVVTKLFVPDNGIRNVYTFIGTAIYLSGRSHS